MHTLNPCRCFALLLAITTLTLPYAYGQNKPEKAFPDRYQEKWEKNGPNVRVKRHQDGSRTVFQRSPENKTLVKRMFGPNGAEKLVTVYRVNSQGNPLACKIWDGRKTLLYKVAYGYSRKTGRLEAERMFDARVHRPDPRNPSKEAPIRIMYYNYDAAGNPTAPEVYTFHFGKTADEVFGNGTFPHENPFKKP